MKHIRFFLCVLGGYISGLAVALFFVYAARALNDGRLALSVVVLVPLIVFLFGWLYFKAVREISWRQRIEAIAVWVGFIVIFDIALLLLWMKGSLSDIGAVSFTGYGLTAAALFTAAYITTKPAPKLASPDLLLNAK
ncbi:MAG: hypothetical protein AAB886_00015 [Patescibacteria group bacterium]